MTTAQTTTLTEQPGSDNARYPKVSLTGHDSSESSVLYPKLLEAPPSAVSSNGCWIKTADGKNILDASCGAAVSCLGHSNQRVKDAIVRQLDNVAYCYALYLTNEPVERLSRELSMSTGGKMSKAFIVSSGELSFLRPSASLIRASRHGIN